MMSPVRFSRLAGAAAPAVLLLGTAPAALAEAPREPQAAAATDDAQDVDGVTVTARRREESGQATPIALQVMTGARLAQTGVNSIVQLTRLVPTLQVLSPNPRNTALTIRGLGASYGLANDGLEQGVGVYVDQVYNSRPAVATTDFIDIRQVEVLRGPQGTLFGKNTTAGALNITTLDAGDAFEAAVEGTFGGDNFRQAKATVSGPLVQGRVDGRLSFVGTWRDGNIYNPVQRRRQNAQDSQAVRGQLVFTPTGRLKVRLYADYTGQHPECCTQLHVRVGATLKPLAQQYAALAAGKAYRPPSTDPYDRLADVNGQIQADQWLSGLAAIVDYDLGFAGLTSVTAHREWDWEPRNDRDYTALDVTRRSNNPSHQRQDSQELRLTSNGGHALEWTVGLYYFRQDVATHGVTEYGADAAYWLLPATNSPASLLDGYTVFNTSGIDTTSYAAFGQLTWKVTDRLRLTPGLRYTDERKDGRFAQTTSGGSDTADAALLSRRLSIARPQAFAARTADGSWSGQVAAAYDPTDDVHAYATWSRGFKSGGINMTALPLNAANAPSLAAAVIRPERATTYELGLKSQVFQGRLTANLAAFATRVNDFQANVVDSGPGALRGYLANVQKVELDGVELDASTRAIGGVTAYANLAWTDARYADFRNGPCPLERIGTSTSACDLSGKALPGVSRWAGSAGLEYRRPAALGRLAGDAYAGVDASYRSAYFADTADSIYTRIKAYGIVNLRAGFRSDPGWEAFVAVRNALDAKYIENLTVVAGASGLVVGTPGDARTLSVTLRARY